jgi:hypothetical protein
MPADVARVETGAGGSSGIAREREGRTGMPASACER